MTEDLESKIELPDHPFIRAVKAEMKASNCNVGEAIARCAQRNPAMHKAYIEAAHQARLNK